MSDNERGHGLLGLPSGQEIANSLVSSGERFGCWVGHNASVHSWPSDAKPGDPCLCGKETARARFARGRDAPLTEPCDHGPGRACPECEGLTVKPPEPSPQERIRCACPSWSRPSECVRIRYGKNPTGSDPEAEIEECECACHAEEEDYEYFW